MQTTVPRPELKTKIVVFPLVFGQDTYRGALLAPGAVYTPIYEILSKYLIPTILKYDTRVTIA